MKRLTARERYQRQVSEYDLEKLICEAVELHGGRCWHARQSQGQNLEDMPDLVIFVPARLGHPGIVALIELKSWTRKTTDGQQHVIRLLDGCSDLVTGVCRSVPREDNEMSVDVLFDRLGLETT